MNLKSYLTVVCIAMISQALYANTPLVNVLKKHKHSFASILPDKYQRGRVHILDISKGSKDFETVDIYSTKALVEHSHQLRQRINADMLVGRYLEDRNIYKRGGESYQTNTSEARSVHLGQDLMVPAGTPVYAPLAGTVHSFKDNKGTADYGPTIILEHHLDGITFYTLYGHLSRKALPLLKVGQSIKKHQKIATVGRPFENGGWPEHVHFQIIDNMKHNKGDFVGVIEPSKVKQYAIHCPNPNLILNIDALNNAL